MRDLITLRDHCRAMAEKCDGWIDVLSRRHAAGDAALAADAKAERRLWRQIAGEIDAYVTGDPSVVSTTPDPTDAPLWEETP